MENHKEAHGRLNDIFTGLRKMFVACLFQLCLCSKYTSSCVWQVARTIPKSTVVTIADSRIYCQTKYILTLGLHIVYNQLVYLFVYHCLYKKHTYCCK